jgi:hypothetical protein
VNDSDGIENRLNCIKFFLNRLFYFCLINVTFQTEVIAMKFCFCRFLLAAAILVLAIGWWPASWAKIVIIIASAILTLMSLFHSVCCCRKGKDTCKETS